MMYLSVGQIPGNLGIVGLPPVRGRQYSAEGGYLSAAVFPDDPVGTTTVTFHGVVAGTEIHIYLPGDVEAAGTESCTADQQLTWPVYSLGSPNNDVKITLIKRGIRWQRFDYTSVLGDQTIQIFPQPDLGYNNPA